MTEITRFSRKAVFSDLNNLKVVTATQEEYEKAFGFTEKEVLAGLEECGLGSQKEQVKKCFDTGKGENRSERERFYHGYA